MPCAKLLAEKAYVINKNTDGFYVKTTQGGFSKICVKIKKSYIEYWQLSI
jgi:hypothetical protein